MLISRLIVLLVCLPILSISGLPHCAYLFGLLSVVGISSRCYSWSFARLCVCRHIAIALPAYCMCSCCNVFIGVSVCMLVRLLGSLWIC